MNIYVFGPVGSFVTFFLSLDGVAWTLSPKKENCVCYSSSCLAVSHSVQEAYYAHNPDLRAQRLDEQS